LRFNIYLGKMISNFKQRIEPIEIQSIEGAKKILLPPLTQDQKDIINPIVPPTSGIRMEIYEKREDEYIMKVDAQYMFLRVFKAVSDIGIKELNKKSPKVLLVSDDRPSASRLIKFCGGIFARDGYQIYFQSPNGDKAKQQAEKDRYYSRMGTPHASATLSLTDEIDLVVVITASHNELEWNGIKFYIELPLPISGRIMQSVSKRAIELTEVYFNPEFEPNYIDSDSMNNDYILNLAEKIVDLTVLKNKKILLWPYMGNAPEIQDLFEKAGVNVILVDEQVEPPNPTAYIDNEKIQKIMIKEEINIAILLDADRDRVVIILNKENGKKFITLSPNELYTAMHNILATKMNKTIINVRTVPSDPRCDSTAKLNFITGVGYKHLGMIIYGALGKSIDKQKFQSGILYIKTPSGFEKILKPELIPQYIQNSGIRGENIIMVLWEESGGHTFNILNISEKSGEISIENVFPAIGDKYPATAILILCALIEHGFDIIGAVDRTLIGTRTTISAEDEKKMQIINTFAKLKGKTFDVDKYQYSVNSFEQVNDKIVIIHLHNDSTNIYFRPSGTGPSVRIYLYGPEATAKDELTKIQNKINEMFP
jgi:phosphomannomutase